MRKLRILLAEDNDGDVYLVHHALRYAGIDYDLHVCSTGDKALRYVNTFALPDAIWPDILIIDLNLPGMSGLEILRDFRKYCGDIPVMVFTSSEAPGDVDKAFEAGANRYFHKPSKLHQFLELGTIVRNLVENTHAAARS
jgi:CheY-like chemotaxis protein